MSNFRVGGLVSGLDTERIIAEFSAAQREPLGRLQAQRLALQERRDAWRDIRTRLFNLQNRAADLRRLGTWQAKQVQADALVAAATVSSAAARGEYQLEVLGLARAHAVGSGAFADRNAALGLSGSIHAGEATINVAAGDTLLSLRDKINAADAGISAGVVQVGEGEQALYRLVLSSRATGLAGKISLSDGVGVGDLGSLNLTELSASAPPPAAVTLGAGAAAGRYDLTVSHLASAHQVAGEFLAQGAEPPTYNGTVVIGGKQITVNGTVDDVAAQLSAAGAGVTATVESDGDAKRLVLTTLATGANARLQIEDSDGQLAALGVMQGDLKTFRHELQAARDAVFTLNGVQQQSAFNTGITAAGGLRLDLTDTGHLAFAVTIDGGAERSVLRDLGFLTYDGQEAHTVSAAADAAFRFGGLQLSRSSNRITDIVPGLTLNLTGPGSTTIVVSDDHEQAVEAVRRFVDQFNSVRDFLDTKTAYNADKGEGAILFGDASVGVLKSALWRRMLEPVSGLAAGMSQLADIGIRSGSWDSPERNKLQFDAAALQRALRADGEAVARLFGAMRANVALAGAGAAAGASSSAGPDYAPAGVINGYTGAGRWGSEGGGWESQAAPAPGAEQWLRIDFAAARRIDQVNVHMLDSDSHPAAEHSLKSYDLQYWDGAGWANLAQVQDNVAGVNRLEFAPVTTTAIRLLVRETHGGQPARVVEVEALQADAGVAQRIHDLTLQHTQAGSGLIRAQENSLDGRIRSLDQRMTRLSEHLGRREQLLRRQFLQMESALARLQSQGTALAAQIEQLQAMRPQKRR